MLTIWCLMVCVSVCVCVCVIQCVCVCVCVCAYLNEGTVSIKIMKEEKHCLLRRCDFYH